MAHMLWVSFVLLFLHSCPRQVCSGQEDAHGNVEEVKIAAVLPEDSDRWMFSIARMRPAADIAIQRVVQQKLLAPAHRLTISYRDSKCSESDGMNEAINFYMRDQVNVFFGPICDFAAAPVARQTRFWDIPMVSVGAMARDFRTRRLEVYPLLTRAGAALPLGG